MSKVQISNKKALFTISEGTTSTGKNCLILQLNEFRLSKEAFTELRESVSLAGGFSFMQKGKPAYMKIDKETLNSLLINLPKTAWVKPEKKAEKPTKGKKETAKVESSTDELIKKMLKEIASLNKKVNDLTSGPDSVNSDLPF